ncbi:GNAT family N-acetyltransferase [Streptomyces sp. 7N604]|uniref:GNAT family N-acetyltransferase n=1 Tax=Streptomyces sp. 7N604 TaxID=3457415 RepID=UPI003FCFE9CC
MGVDVGGQDASWRRAAEEWFVQRLHEKGDFAAFVADEPELGVVSSAVGTCDRHAPGPANLSGLHGHVFNISTDPRRRRLGYARACLDVLLAWYRDETDVGVINLNATPRRPEPLPLPRLRRPALPRPPTPVAPVPQPARPQPARP